MPRPATGRVGWLCTYTPEELLLAAGMQGVRLSGDFANEDRAKACYSSTICPYLRAALGAALGEACGPLAGVVVANACDGLRRLADVWAHYVPDTFVYLLDVPRSSDEAAVRYFAGALQGLRRYLEEYGGRAISDDALWEAIALQNGVRRALVALAECRRQGAFREPARAFYEIVWRSVTEPREAFARWLEGELAGDRFASRHLVGRRPNTSADGPRVVLSGNILTPLDYPVLDLLEESGAYVAADDLCTGERHFRQEVEEGKDGDPLAALARRYLGRTPCSRMANAAERADSLLETCREAEAGGVVYVSQKFCDAFLYDFPYFKARLAADGLRVMLLELDASQGSLGQARTRLQAFLEML